MSSGPCPPASASIHCLTLQRLGTVEPVPLSSTRLTLFGAPPHVESQSKPMFTGKPLYCETAPTPCVPAFPVMAFWAPLDGNTLAPFPVMLTLKCR